MNRKTVISTAAFLAVILSAPTAYAIFGIGDIVFDPSNYAQAIEQVMRLEQQYMQLVQTYQMIRSQYEHLQNMARRVPVDMKRRYRAELTPWNQSTASNASGATGRWTAGINKGIDVLDGYLEAVQSLTPLGTALENIPADQRRRVQSNYATVELADGANVAAMETIGRLRGSAGAVEAAIQGLEDDSLSASPEMNTEIAVLNKINAANLISIRTAQDSNKLLVALAESQIIDGKRKRDAEAQAINNYVRFRQEGRAVLADQTADASSAMRRWRMP
jgi:hypothetical protein